MKKINVLVLTLLISLSGFSQGIVFENLPFEKVLEKARNENKKVFLDCYTSWCGPCKKLSKEVFPKQMVGDYFNPRFVSLKVDMEKGEGIELCKKYGVKMFPTLLFLNNKGEILDKTMGFVNETALIEQAKTALNPNEKSLGSLQRKYEEGNRDLSFLVDYCARLYDGHEDEMLRKVGKEFIKNTPASQMLNKESFAIIDVSNALEYNSEAYKFLIANKHKFIAMDDIDDKRYEFVVQRSATNYLDSIADKGTIDELKHAINEVKDNFEASKFKWVKNEATAKYYLSNKKYEKWYDLAISQAKETLKKDEKKGNLMLFNTIRKATHDLVFESVDLNNRVIKDAKEYLSNNPDVIITHYHLAYLYKRLGNKKEAINSINSFIDLAGEEDNMVKYAKKFKEELKGL